MIDKGANNWDWAMECAARNNHIEIVLLMINKGANNWNRAMENAAENNHMEMVLFLIDKGADISTLSNEIRKKLYGNGLVFDR